MKNPVIHAVSRPVPAVWFALACALLVALVLHISAAATDVYKSDTVPLHPNDICEG